MLNDFPYLASYENLLLYYLYYVGKVSYTYSTSNVTFRIFTVYRYVYVYYVDVHIDTEYNLCNCLVELNSIQFKSIRFIFIQIIECYDIIRNEKTTSSACS